MVNNIIFLGTAGDSIVYGKQIRASGGIVLHLEGNQFLINPGPGCLVRARQAEISIRDSTAVFVSNSNTLNSGDLNAVLEGMSVEGLDRIGVLLANKNVIFGNEKEISILKKKNHHCVEKVLDLESGRKLSINDINITTTKTNHLGSEGLGFVFKTHKYSIGIVPDTEFSEEIAEQYAECEVLIINCRSPDDIKEEGYMNREGVIKFINVAKPKLAIITGFGIKVIQADPLFEAREIQKETKVEVVAAKDGLIINPITHSVGMKQISLDSFS